jgi:hypothetical protein
MIIVTSHKGKQSKLNLQGGAKFDNNVQGPYHVKNVINRLKWRRPPSTSKICQLNKGMKRKNRVSQRYIE